MPAHGQLVDVVGERVAQKIARSPIRVLICVLICVPWLEIDREHVRDVEHARVAAHRVVLLDLRAVADRHVPAAEIDHLCAGGAVQGIRVESA